MANLTWDHKDILINSSSRNLTDLESAITSSIRRRLYDQGIGTDRELTQEETIEYVWTPFKERFISGLKAHFPNITSDIDKFVEELNKELPNNDRTSVLQFSEKLQEKLGIDEKWEPIKK